MELRGYVSFRKTAPAPRRGDPIRFRTRPNRICGGQSDTGQGYSPITSAFPLSLPLPRPLHVHTSVITNTAIFM